MATVIVMAQCM